MLWIPGTGPDGPALARLCAAFPRPAVPMGEAWFMGETRRMFPALMGDPAAVPVGELAAALEEIASGTAAFGPREEWRDWLHYLLPRLVPRAHEAHVAALAETLVTAFISQHPGGAVDPAHPGFRADVLTTLGRCLMAPACWPQGRLDPGFALGKPAPEPGGWAWAQAGGRLSALLFLCVKYLEPAEIGPWAASFLAIDDPLWRAQLTVWLVGAHPLLTGTIAQPADLPESHHPAIDWDWSHVLTGRIPASEAAPAPFLPPANGAALVAAVRASLTPEMYEGWLTAFAADPALEAELGDLPFGFYGLYLQGAG
ncbi:hypothetical protein GCM10007301_39890 [Azorhizobium oxalatiphilum]|uniref:Uncharacterized protein n=1 Tax=Azorhizobium oxalatiphilum TaxID=980631 RepID=A0A917C9A5_9HYPH|nr:hypothetical protein GCM10007301_39890 [Azorhizobium oxalatiphilum]